MKSKTFHVASVSSNKNSFGLTGMILIARDGETWEVAANDLNRKPKGTVIKVPVHHHSPDFSSIGFEIPERLTDAPPAVVKEVTNYLALQ